MKFSITIPAYKRTYLKEAIDSCLAQTYNDFEIIIVNDASPEDLDSIVNSYSDDRIRYYKNETNCGAINVVDNWNKCLEYAQGEYIICMGDDDRLLPCCLEEYVKLMEIYPNLGVYHAWTEIIDEKDEFYKLQHPRPLYEGAYSLLWNRWNGRGLQYIGDFCFDIKKLKDDGGFYKLPMAWASDDITAVRAARYGGIANTQVLCFQYRENRNSISRSGFHHSKMDAAIGEKKWYHEFLEHHLPSDDIEAKYKMMVSTEVAQHFKEKMKNQLVCDMRSNLWRVLYWLWNRKKYGVSTARILLACDIAFKSRFHGR